MPFLHPADRAFLQPLRELTYCNPFLPERIALEREILGNAFTAAGADWNAHPESVAEHPNLTELFQRCADLIERLSQSLARGTKPNAEDADLYEHLVLFKLYHNYVGPLRALIRRGGRTASAGGAARVYDDFRSGAARLLAFPGLRPIDDAELAHLFACFWQMQRAFYHIFNNIIGISAPAARFRADVWQSMFTHNMRRYRRTMYDRLADFTTLITGPSGTGKELAARAIGLSRYVPFDPQTRKFLTDIQGTFHAVNLSALSPTLIESELFGHRRGAFTGAVADRTGWLETCPPLGTVFLDEIGDVEHAIQLKLLRVLETRTFQRIGDTTDRHFRGKIIAATNRDLAEERRAGRFRDDFYYRICADVIRTPSLHERITECPDELRHLLLFLTRRIAGDEAERLTDEVCDYIGKQVGAEYSWPGNVRELEQCVRNVLVRREYRPTQPVAPTPAEAFAQDAAAGTLTAEQLLNRYCLLVYAQCGSYQETARRIGLDRRTVKTRVSAVDSP